MITFCFWGILLVAALSSVISLTQDIRYISRWIASLYFKPVQKAITINIKLASESALTEQPHFLPLLLISEDSTVKNAKRTLQKMPF